MKVKLEDPEEFTEVGYRKMLATVNEQIAGAICGQKLEVYRHKVEIAIGYVRSEMRPVRQHIDALGAILYAGDVPVCDAEMLANTKQIDQYRIMFYVCVAAAIACSTWTFSKLGANPVLAVIGGLLTTTVMGGVMYLMHSLLGNFKWWKVGLELAVGLVAAALCFWGMVELAQARTAMVVHEASNRQSQESQSFVDDSSAQPDEADKSSSDEGAEQSIYQHVGASLFSFAMACELILGILLAMWLRIRNNPLYVAWCELHDEDEKLDLLMAQEQELAVKPQIAQKACLAGILEAKAELEKQRKHQPRPTYHRRAAVAAVALVLFSGTAFAQSFDRAEAILVDVSGSIGKGTNNELFRQYLTSTRGLLLQAPPKTRVFVSVITTDSFGSTGPLLRGWTPDSKGVFTDDLNRARHELASSFATKAASLRPMSAGTDIFGGLWQLQTLFDSATAQTKEVFILSDMMNETPNFNMPALLAFGPEKMMEMARSNNKIVPLKGYRIHVLGASTQELTPEAWNTMKSFWTLYFHDAGAELVSYSPDCSVGAQ